MSIDWSKAPEGALYFDTASELFFDEEGYYTPDGERRPSYNLKRVPPRFIPRPTKTEWVDGLPDAYACPAGCGCLWRDNGDDTMSLYGPQSQSCDVCEPLPMSRLVPVKFLCTEAEKLREELYRLAWRYLDQAGIKRLEAGAVDAVLDAIFSKYNLTEK